MDPLRNLPCTAASQSLQWPTRLQLAVHFREAFAPTRWASHVISVILLLEHTGTKRWVNLCGVFEVTAACDLMD